MTTEIIDPSYLTNGSFVELNLGVGPGTAQIGAREVVLVGPKLSTGSYTAGTKVLANSEAEVIAGAASGSPLHRAYRRFVMGNRRTKVWVLPIAETSGGSPVAGTLVLTISGTITDAGWIDLYVCGEQCRYTFTTTDTPTTCAAGLVAIINAKRHLPVIATNSSGALTLTAKLKGASQNSTILARTAVKAGTGAAWSAASGYVGDSVAGAEGSTTEAANLSTALATLDADGGYYLGLTAFDSTSIGHLVTHLTACADPQVGLRKRGVIGFNGSKSSAASLATARNYERLHIAAMAFSDHDAAELMAGTLAVLALEENVDPSFAPVNYRGGAFTLSPCSDPAQRWTGADISDLKSDGVIPICSTDTYAYIEDGVTTRSKDATGTYDDRRALWSERISMGDALAARIVSTWAQRYQGKKLEPDVTLADGTVDDNQVYDIRTVRPSQARDLIVEILRNGERDKELVNVDDSVASISVAVSSTNSQRLVARSEFEVIGYARQATFQVDEVSA